MCIKFFYFEFINFKIINNLSTTRYYRKSMLRYHHETLSLILIFHFFKQVYIIDVVPRRYLAATRNCYVGTPVLHYSF